MRRAIHLPALSSNVPMLVVFMLLSVSPKNLFCGCAQTDGAIFRVQATLSKSTCGSGAVDASDSWNFKVRLHKDGSTLTWEDVDSGMSTQGVIGSDSFSVSAGSKYEVTASTEGSVGCSVRRHDNYSGSVSYDKSGDISKLDGVISFNYTLSTGYNCDALIGTANGFEDLPCEVDYKFEASPN